MLLLEFSAFAYLLIMLLISIGWYLTKVFIPSSISSETKVSVVVAVRNEAKNIKELLFSILHQSYPKNLFELIIVDDNSEDTTLEIVGDFKHENPDLNIIIIQSTGKGKKEALKEGFKSVSNHIIITTDGDCVVSNDWILDYVTFFEKTDVQLVFGPVFYFKSKRFIEKLFSLEFATLVASGAGSSGVKMPLMGNGANMAIRKSAYDKVGKSIKGDDFASGDDVFLMHSVASYFDRNAIQFLKNKNCIVETSAPKNLKNFFNQRIRWGSKAKAYTRIWPLTVSIIVFIFNSLLGITAILSFFKLWFLAVFVLFVVFKFLIDFPLTRNYIRFYNRPINTLLLFPLEFLYPFYIMFTTFFSIFIPYKWKGRKLVK